MNEKLKIFFYPTNYALPFKWSHKNLLRIRPSFELHDRDLCTILNAGNVFGCLIGKQLSNNYATQHLEFCKVKYIYIYFIYSRSGVKIVIQIVGERIYFLLKGKIILQLIPCSLELFILFTSQLTEARHCRKQINKIVESNFFFLRIHGLHLDVTTASIFDKFSINLDSWVPFICITISPVLLFISLIYSMLL